MIAFVEVFACWFRQHFTSYVTPVFAKSLLEGAAGAANIFTIWEVWTIVLSALPVIENVLGLAVDTVFDGVTVATGLTYHLTGCLHRKWAGWTGSSVFGTLFPARGRTGGSCWSWSCQGA